MKGKNLREQFFKAEEREGKLLEWRKGLKDRMGFFLVIRRESEGKRR